MVGLVRRGTPDLQQLQKVEARVSRLRSHLQATARPNSHPACPEHATSRRPCRRRRRRRCRAVLGPASVSSILSADPPVKHRPGLGPINRSSKRQNRAELRLLDRHRPGTARAGHSSAPGFTGASIPDGQPIRPGHWRLDSFARWHPLLSFHSVCTLRASVAGDPVRSYNFSSKDEGR